MDRGPRTRVSEAFGTYVRNQRLLAQLSLRQAAALARISNPYLSQIEHGMALPSVTVIRALADALDVSADALLLRAAGVPADAVTGPATTEDAVRNDPRLDDAQKRALLTVLTAFVGTSSGATPDLAPPADITLRVRRRRQSPSVPSKERGSEHA